MVTVYSKPACVQCTATISEMQRREIAHQIVDLSEDESAMKKVMDMGYRQAPVVIAGDEHWSGFRPDKIGTLG